MLEAEVDVAQGAEGAVGADLGGADGAFEDAGDLGEGEFLEAGEEEDFAVVAVELGEGGVEQGVVVAGGGVVGGVRTLVGVVVEIGGIGGVGGGAGAAEVVGGAAAREVIHPGGEAAVVAVGVAVFEHPLENRLREVLGDGALAGEFDEKAEERAVMALEQLPERVELAVADGQHQGVVGAWFGGGGGVHGGQSAGAINQSGARRNMNFV